MATLLDYLEIATKVAKHHNLTIAINSSGVQAMKLLDGGMFETVLERNSLKDMAKMLPILLETDCKFTLKELELICPAFGENGHENLQYYLKHILKNGTHPIYNDIQKAIDLFEEKTNIKLNIGFTFDNDTPNVKVTPEIPMYFVFNGGETKLLPQEVKGMFLQEFVDTRGIVKDGGAPILYNLIADVFLDSVYYEANENLEQILHDVRGAVKEEIEERISNEMYSHIFHKYRSEEMNIVFDMYGNLYVNGGTVNVK